MKKICYTIKIKLGNLVLEKDADIIINASNTMLVLGSGVSMAFKHHCGNKLQIQMDEILTKIHNAGYMLKKGDVVPSEVGNAINFKQTLHVAMVDYNSGVNFLEKKPDLATIDTALNNIEYNIKEYALERNKNRISIVIPLLGCGIGGLDKLEVIERYRIFFGQERPSDILLNCQVIIYAYSDFDVKILSEKFAPSIK